MSKISGRTVVLDLDDTLASMREPLHKILNEEAGMDLHWSNWNTVCADSLYNVTPERFFELALAHRLIERLVPHTEAKPFMDRLAATGAKINILSARGWHPRGKTITEGWLRHWEIPYDEIFICGVEDVKADYIKDMGSILFAVDDSPRHCNQYAQSENAPDYVFAYEMPWTERKLHPESGSILIKSLDEIGNYIEGL